MTDYVLSSKSADKAIPDDSFIAYTIVTSDLLGAIAQKYDVNVVDNLLVGFKYIGEQIHLRADEGNQTFLCGGEESYGGIIGDYCRDKDAAGPTAALCEYAAQLKAEGKTLLDRLSELYEHHGVFHEDLHSEQFPGADGFLKMQQFMKLLREQPPETLGEHRVMRIRDYAGGKEIEGRSGDVLRIEVSDDGRNRVTVRPSGTEPKLKVYTQVHVPVSNGDVAEAKKKAHIKASELKESIIALIDEQG